jgi:PII-like signaling protein
MTRALPTVAGIVELEEKIVAFPPVLDETMSSGLATPEKFKRSRMVTVARGLQGNRM